jgi:hypothetical protein
MSKLTSPQRRLLFEASMRDVMNIPDPEERVTAIFTKFLGWKNPKVESIVLVRDKPLEGDLLYKIEISYDKTTQNIPHWSSGAWDDALASGLRPDEWNPRMERESMILGWQPIGDYSSMVYDILGRPAQAFNSSEAKDTLKELIKSYPNIEEK